MVGQLNVVFCLVGFENGVGGRISELRLFRGFRVFAQFVSCELG